MFDFLNNHLTISNYKYKNKKIPTSFNNFKILQISDLHDKLYGKNQNIIIKKIISTNPDIIVMTGDILDDYEFENSLVLIKKCIKICPVYFVEGNHEFHSEAKVDFYLKMLDIGVHIIDNKKEKIKIKNEYINICGCSMHTKIKNTRDFYNISRKIKKLDLKPNEFNIILFHRPEFLEFLSIFNIDLIFSGHAHGGQWRLFGKGLFAPDQGIFPKYTAGIHKVNNTAEIISRGLGNKVIYPRINNFPELVVCTLICEK